MVETKPDIITPSVIDIPDSKSDISSSSAQPQLTSVDIRVIITGTPFDFRVRVASLEMHAAIIINLTCLVSVCYTCITLILISSEQNSSLSIFSEGGV